MRNKSLSVLEARYFAAQIADIEKVPAYHGGEAAGQARPGMSEAPVIL